MRKLVVLLWLALLLLLAFSTARGQALGDNLVWLPLIFRSHGVNPIHTGMATYYHADGTGSCMFAPSPNDLMVAAYPDADWNNSLYCGATMRVAGPEGEVDVRIVDMCAGCRVGHLDLSVEAFDLIGSLGLGRVPITYQLLSPPLNGPIAYHFKDGSNQWWTALHIRNHRNPIASLEYYNGSQWIAVPRTDYNYFVQTHPGMGPGPYSFRVTDIYGNVLVDTGIPHVENGTVNGAAQFPPGP